jgi:hypothetical protein
MSSVDKIEFTLVQEEIEVVLHRPDDPIPWECVVREMNGYQRDMFLNKQKDKANIRTKEVKDFKDVQTELIARCLYNKGTNELVPVIAIRDFPSKVQGKIYDLCVKINGLNETAEVEAKND